MDGEVSYEIVKKWIEEKQEEAKSEEFENVLKYAKMEHEEEVEMSAEWIVMVDLSNNDEIRKIAEWVCKKKRLTLVSVIGGLSKSIPVAGTFYAMLFKAKDQKGKTRVYEAVVFKAPIIGKQLLSCLAIPLP